MAINNTIRTLTADNIEGIVAPHNYVTSSFENGTITGWSLFNTTLTSGLPTGSIGAGAASLTLGTTTTNALSGSYSLQMVGAGVVTAGQGFISDVFSVNRESYAKVLTYKAAYEVASGAANANFSGTLGSQSFAWYLYDVSNSAWVQPAGFLGMNQSSGPGLVSGTFQTNASGNQYRLACICLQATAGAVTINFDNITLSQQTAPIGAVMTDWQAWTPIYTGFGTVTPSQMQYRRQGDTLEFRGNFTTGTPTAVNASFSLPTGLVCADTTKIPATQICGHFGLSASGLAGYELLADPSGTAIFFSYQNGSTGALTKETGSGISVAGATYTVFGQVPIQGWSSNVQMSSDTDTRVVAASYGLTSAQAVGLNAVLKYDTKVVDTHAAYSTSTGLFTAPVTGNYAVVVNWNGSVGGGTYLLKNGVGAGYVGTANANSYISGSQTIQLNAGDTLGVYADTARTYAASSTNGYINSVSINRLSGPSVIAATETVTCKIFTTNARAIGTSTPIIIYEGVTKDSHNAYNSSTGTWTCPVSGTYLVTGGFITLNGASYGANNAIELAVFKNASIVGNIAAVRFQAASTSYAEAMGSDTFQFNAGDQITFRIYSDISNTLVTNQTNTNKVSVTRIGN